MFLTKNKHSEWPYRMADHGGHRSYGKTPYHVITGPGGLLAHLLPFEGNTMRAVAERHTTKLVWHDSTCWHSRGRWQRVNLPPEDHYYTYEVYSYNKQIGQVTLASERDKAQGYDLYREFWVDDEYYSQTTRRHQGYVQAWMGQAIPELMGVDPTYA